MLACCSCSWTPGIDWRRRGEYTPPPESGEPAPHPASGALSFRFGAFQLVESREREPGGDAREAVAHERGVHEEAVLAHHVCKMPVVRVHGRAFVLEAHPATEDHRGEPVARLASERRGGVEAMTDFRRVDAEQAHAADGRHVDGVTVDHSCDDHGIGPVDFRDSARCLNSGNSREQQRWQNLQWRLPLARDCAVCGDASATRPPAGWAVGVVSEWCRTRVRDVSDTSPTPSISRRTCSPDRGW